MHDSLKVGWWLVQSYNAMVGGWYNPTMQWLVVGTSYKWLVVGVTHQWLVAATPY